MVQFEMRQGKTGAKCFFWPDPRLNSGSVLIGQRHFQRKCDRYKPEAQASEFGYKPETQASEFGYKPEAQASGFGYKPEAQASGFGCK